MGIARLYKKINLDFSTQEEPHTASNWVGANIVYQRNKQFSLKNGGKVKRKNLPHKFFRC